MSWLKLGRWVLVGAAAALGASACGGRGNLPTGDAFAGDGSGDQPFGGAFGTSGAMAVGGVNAFGGTVVGGFGGSLVIGGAGGAPNVCKPGSLMCDATGKFAQVCAPDGLSALNKVDCGARGQRCQDGNCKSLVCLPNQLFCDKAGVRLCNMDGSSSSVWQNCGANQYCDPAAPSCKNGVCAPNQPACNGSVATTCNANGSGYLAMGVDCNSQPDRQCVLGACLCPPSLADCDGSTKTGCEANVSTDPKNCTGCGIACSTNNVPSPTCDDGCNGKCAIGFQDCNADKLKDGCEVSTAGDAKNCGGCGVACSNNHVTASCSGSVCNGACAANFADCNGSKLKDGCESDSRTDANNCGACGVACSTNHLKPTCAAGACGGTCEGGFDDCNGNKQTDGCETNTLNDDNNCGMCGKVCSGGDKCTAGKCGSLVTFSGVATGVTPASLSGWTQCFSETYAQTMSSVDAVRKACTGSLLMMACRAVGTDALQVAAYAPRADVLFDTGLGNDPHVANGVGWYFNGSHSWGFAPAGDAITRNSCDTQDSTIDATGVDGSLRLCWHTSGDFIQGGWRCGRNDNLNGSFAYERLIFQAQ